MTAEEFKIDPALYKQVVKNSRALWGDGSDEYPGLQDAVFGNEDEGVPGLKDAVFGDGTPENPGLMGEVFGTGGEGDGEDGEGGGTVPGAPGTGSLKDRVKRLEDAVFGDPDSNNPGLIGDIYGDGKTPGIKEQLEEVRNDVYGDGTDDNKGLMDAVFGDGTPENPGLVGEIYGTGDDDDDNPGGGSGSGSTGNKGSLSGRVNNLENRMDQVEKDLYGDEETDTPGLKEIVDTIEKTIFGSSSSGGGSSGGDGPSNPGNSDVVYDPNKGTMNVYGVSFNNIGVNENSPPSAYKHNITQELKRKSAIGLGDAEGITQSFVLVITYLNDDPSISYKTWQLAIGDPDMVMYRRFAKDKTTWEAWAKASCDCIGPQPEPDPIPYHWQIIESKNTPVGQQPGDIWMEILEGDNTNLRYAELENSTHRQIIDSATSPSGQLAGDYWLETKEGAPGNFVYDNTDYDHKQLIESTYQPSGQIKGDYWMKPM